MLHAIRNDALLSLHFSGGTKGGSCFSVILDTAPPPPSRVQRRITHAWEHAIARNPAGIFARASRIPRFVVRQSETATTEIP
jgi:hypothetical protein